jgi:hypothetical protein
MISAWTKHVKDPEEAEQFKNKVLSAKVVLERLQELVMEDEASLYRSEIDIKTFDLPNWENKQAYRNAFRACLYKYAKLIDLDQ